MKVLDFIVGVMFATVSTVLFMAMSLVMYIPSLLMVLYIGVRSSYEGTLQTELTNLNKTFMSNIKHYIRKFI